MFHTFRVLKKEALINAPEKVVPPCVRGHTHGPTEGRNYRLSHIGRTFIFTKNKDIPCNASGSRQFACGSDRRASIWTSTKDPPKNQGWRLDLRPVTAACPAEPINSGLIVAYSQTVPPRSCAYHSNQSKRNEKREKKFSFSFLGYLHSRFKRQRVLAAGASEYCQNLSFRLKGL
jgi:hypothetical protein